MTNKTSNIENNKEIKIDSQIKSEADSNLAKSNEIIADNLTDLIELVKKYQNPQTVHDYFSSLQVYRLIIESSLVLRKYLAENSLLNEGEEIKSQKVNERLSNSLKYLTSTRDEFNKITKDLLDVKVC